MSFIERLQQLPWLEGRTKRMKVVESLLLADRRSLLMVECEGQRFLLGSTPGAITLIAELAEFQGEGRAQ